MRTPSIGRRFGSWPLVTALLVAGCQEEPTPIVNEPTEAAELRAAGKTPWEIRAELRAREATKALKGASLAGRRTH